VKFGFFTSPKLTSNLPSMPIVAPNLKIPAGLAMADPAFGTPQAIDMILSAKIFFDLFNKEKMAAFWRLEEVKSDELYTIEERAF